MSSASPRAEIRGVGQQLFDVKLGRKSLQLGVSQMSLTLFKSDNSPLRTILYQKIASVDMTACAADQPMIGPIADPTSAAVT